MSAADGFLNPKQRHQPIMVPQEFSDEEMIRDWTLSEEDKQELNNYRKSYRTFVALQICAIRLYGRFINNVSVISIKIINYLNQQLNLPPMLSVTPPEREATFSEQRRNILEYLGFTKYDEIIQEKLKTWLYQLAKHGHLPNELFQKSELYLLNLRVVLPGPTILERLIISVCTEAHQQLFEIINKGLSADLKTNIDNLLATDIKTQITLFQLLKEYPPSATISSLQSYLKRYQVLDGINIDSINLQFEQPFIDYLYKLTTRYNAYDIKRFSESKRYSMMACFLIETRKTLLDYLVKMHDQFIQEMLRESKHLHEKKHREFRKRQKSAIDVILTMTEMIFTWPDDKPLPKNEILQHAGESKLKNSVTDLYAYKQLEERGLGDILLNRYPSLRKYFATFITLPFMAKHGSEQMLTAINTIRQLDAGLIKNLPNNLPIYFIPKELQCCYKNKDGKIHRNAWELGLAIAIKDALRSGDLYLPKSKQHVSFWELVINEQNWQATKESAYHELNQPQPSGVKQLLITNFFQTVNTAKKSFAKDNFAEIVNGKLKLKRDDKADIPEKVKQLQKLIDSRMPIIRIEQLLIEVDQQINFTRYIVPVQQHNARPRNFYKSLIAAIISQATNLGIVAMSSSVEGITVDMLRHIFQFYVREETIQASSAEIVNQHHQLPFAEIHGSGHLSSSDAQRFKLRADSLLSAYYPRYYGYYEKAIGIYTHVSDQYAVFSTKVISCSPREALYVLDGLLENNTILKIHEHTTDTHGYTEIIFALCYLLGFRFMPRIKDLKDQQLYRVEKTGDYGIFNLLLNKTADIDIVEEQWEPMIRVAQSLKQKTAPAHVIVQRLTNSFPSDRLSRAFTNLGRIIKTEYILQYITDQQLRRKVQLQLNKGEYRHKLPRWIFFANQGEFTTNDYEEIMNKASCLSLVSNAILYWNTNKIKDIVTELRENGEEIDDETLSHISLLPFKHILPNGTYFIKDKEAKQ